MLHKSKRLVFYLINFYSEQPLTFSFLFSVMASCKTAHPSKPTVSNHLSQEGWTHLSTFRVWSKSKVFKWPETVPALCQVLYDSQKSYFLADFVSLQFFLFFMQVDYRSNLVRTISCNHIRLENMREKCKAAEVWAGSCLCVSWKLRNTNLTGLFMWGNFLHFYWSN